MEFYSNLFNLTSLISAAIKGYTETVRLLLTQSDIDINKKDIVMKNVYNIQILLLNDI